MNVAATRSFILRKLRTELPPDLFYHGVHHTLDVTGSALAIAGQEGITDQVQLDLLETAALYHDCGFIYTYEGHEEEGCRVVKETLPEFGYSMDHIEVICGIIMATKLPQNARTHLEEIICDADLDYLGRSDFQTIGDSLYEELKVRNRITDRQSWNEVQIHFLSQHRYKTNTSQKLRENDKQNHLLNLKKGLP